MAIPEFESQQGDLPSEKFKENFGKNLNESEGTPHLTPRESQLLEMLENAEGIVPYADLEEKFGSYSNVRFIIHKIRRKGLKILNIRGTGYCLKERNSQPEVTWKFGEISIREQDRSIELPIKGRVELSPREFQVLMLLVQKKGGMVAVRELGKVWGDSENVDSKVRVTIHYIRRKIEEDPENPKIIVNRRGLGYVFLPEDDIHLTPTERRILELFGEEKSLNIHDIKNLIWAGYASYSAVRTHMSNLRKKGFKIILERGNYLLKNH